MAWTSYGAAALVVATLSLACEPASPSDEIRHPTNEHLPSASEVDNVIPREQPEDQAAPDDPGLVELAEALRSARQLWLAGTADGPPGTVFGEIRDVAVDSLGRVYVLDAQYNEVRRFSSEGEFLDRFFQPGQGPLEFRNPESIEIDAYGRMMIASRSHGIKIFGWNESQSRYGLIRNIRGSTVLPRDMCMIGETMFARQWKSKDGEQEQDMEALIHAVDTVGMLQRSFGLPYPSESSLIRQGMSRGRLGCVPTPQTVINVFERLPIIRAYSAAGELRWTSLLADLQLAGFIQVGTTARQGEELTAGMGLVQNAVGVPGGYIIVQIFRRLPEPVSPGDPIMALDSYLLSARTGRGLYLGESLPLVLAVGENRYYAQVLDLIPRVGAFLYVGQSHGMEMLK